MPMVPLSLVVVVGSIVAQSRSSLFITHHTVSGTNLTGPDFLEHKSGIVAALKHKIEHGDLDRMAQLCTTKTTL